MKKYYAFLFAIMTALIGFSASAARTGTVTLHLEKGSTATLLQYSLSTANWDVKKILEEGDNVIEYEYYQQYRIAPGFGMTDITVDPEMIIDGQEYVAKNIDKTTGLPYYLFYATYRQNEMTFNITTVGEATKPTTHIFLEPGAKARVLELNERTMEYSLHRELHEGDNAVELEMESQFISGTVPFYYLCGDEGYTINTVTNGKGININTGSNSAIGTYVEITAFTMLPEYHVTTKEKPAPEGDPNFILSTGSCAYYTPSGGGNKQTLFAGDNWVTITYSESIFVYPANGNHFVSFTDKRGTEYKPNNFGAVEISGGSTFNPPYYITTEANTEPDPTYTINIDNPDKVLCYTGAGSSVVLKKGLNTLTYNTYGDDRIVLKIDGLNPTPPFASMEINGVVQPSSDEFVIELTPNMEIVAKADFPDEEYTIKLEYSSPQIEEFWTMVEVDGTEVEVIDNEFKAPAGAKIVLRNSNASRYTVKEVIALNGYKYTSKTVSSITTFAIANNGVIKVDAQKAKQINVTVNISANPTDLSMTIGSVNGTIINLLNGTNNVTLLDNNNTLVLRMVNDVNVKRCEYKVSPEAEYINPSFNQYYKTYTMTGLQDGGVINIVAGNYVDGIEEVETDTNTPAIYYDLTGQRVHSERLIPGIYVKVQNGKAVKVVIK